MATLALFDPLLPFLRIEVPSSTQSSLVLSNKRTDNSVLAGFRVVLAVRLDGKGTRIQAWPVDLVTVMLAIPSSTNGRVLHGGE